MIATTLQVCHLLMLLPARQLQFVAAMLASRPSVSKAKKGKCELLLVPVLFPVLEQMPQSDARE